MVAMRFPAALVFLFAAAPEALATPARVNAIDGGNFLVPDDWDVTNFYSLAPAFANHAYFYYPLERRPYAWPIFGVKPLGAFIFWLDRDVPTSSFFTALPALGLSNAALGGAAPGLPQEDAVAVPDMKIRGGWGKQLTEGVSVGLCGVYATTQRDQSAAPGGGQASGELALLPGASSTVLAYDDFQRSLTTVIAPNLSLKAEWFALDMVVNVIGLGVDNGHHEVTRVLAAGPGVVTAASLTSTLKGSTGANHQDKFRLLVPLSEGVTWSTYGQYTSLDLTLQHHVTGVFDAAAYTGFDHVNRTQSLKAVPWTLTTGVLQRLGSLLVVVGGGLDVNDVAGGRSDFSPKAGTSGFDTREETSTTSVHIREVFAPLLSGVEYSPLDWLRLRAVAQRNVLAFNRTSQEVTVHDTAGNLVSRSDSSTASNDEVDWMLRLGVGITNEAFGWDVLLNLGQDKTSPHTLFFPASAKSTVRQPSVTTAVVFKF